MIEHLGASVATVKRLLHVWADHSDASATYWRDRHAPLMAAGLQRKAARFRTVAESLDPEPATAITDQSDDCYVGLWPGGKRRRPWRVYWHDQLCTPRFASKADAQARLIMYQRGERKPEL